MKAFILAAGYGKRLRPLTDTLPKPLIEVGGKPLIHYHLEKLAQAGVTEIVINAHWLADKLVASLGDGSSFGVQIHWSLEEELLETGGGLKNALPLLGDDPFLLVNGDIYLEFNFAEFVEKALCDHLAHLLLVPNPEQNPAGDFSKDAVGRLTRNQDSNGQTYAGVALVNPKLVADWQSETEAFPLLSPLVAAADRGLLTGEVFNGEWEDVGTLERLEALNARLAATS